MNARLLGAIATALALAACTDAKTVVEPGVTAIEIATQIDAALGATQLELSGRTDRTPAFDPGRLPTTPTPIAGQQAAMNPLPDDPGATQVRVARRVHQLRRPALRRVPQPGALLRRRRRDGGVCLLLFLAPQPPTPGPGTLVARAGPLYTRNVPGGLHVRFVAPQTVRVRRVAAALHCTPEAAAAQIEKIDLARRRYVHANFGEDIDDARDFR